MAVGAILIIIGQTIYTVFATLINLMIWFLTSLLPTLITYIGVPMFVLGIITALGLTGGSVLFFIICAVGMYYFIKKTVFMSSPKLKFASKNNGMTNANMAVFKS